MSEPRETTILRSAELMRRGSLTAEALVLSCLERIEVRQPEVRAWVGLHPEEALAQAHLLDKEAARGRWHGPLHGIPLGVKDIIDVEGMVTRGGCEAYEAGVARRDAPCVARLREAGAIFLGKTATTAFANRDPVPDARNPWNLEHSPGGSSAGSGAAVGDRMCLGALGTQTGGSVLRPAAFNGVVGFKASIGSVHTEGVIPLSWTLDHVGGMARSVEDVHLLWQLMRHDRSLDWQPTREKMIPDLVPHAPRHLWRVRDFFETEADQESVENLEQVCRMLAAHGVEIVEKPLPPSFSDVERLYRVITAAEAATSHRNRYAEKSHLYPAGIAELVEEGLHLPAVEYVSALRVRLLMQQEIARELEGVDAAIMPTALGAAPDPSTTGSPRFNAPWSMCGVPALTLPTRINPAHLPLGVQLVAPQGREEALLQVGGWCESLFAFRATPWG